MMSMTALPSYDDLYAFLKANYKHERFAGRDNRDGWGDYSGDVTRSRMTSLARQGWDLISRYESRTGEIVIFSAALAILDAMPTSGQEPRG